MFLVGLFSWWYGRGWVARVNRAGYRWKQTFRFFSMMQLLRTLFSPYRQISSDEKAVTLGDSMRVFFDRTLSRLIGAIVRMTTILAGLIVIAIQTVVEGILMLGWWLLPLSPVALLLLFAAGWVPSWL